MAAEALARGVPPPAPTPWGGAPGRAHPARAGPCPAARAATRGPRPWGGQLPPADRPHAPGDTAPEVVEAPGRPAAPHHARRTLARPTTPIDRGTTTWRPRGARLVRAAVSVAKQRANPRGAMTRCMGPSNRTRAAAESGPYRNITTVSGAQDFPIALYYPYPSRMPGSLETAQSTASGRKAPPRAGISGSWVGLLPGKWQAH